MNKYKKIGLTALAGSLVAGSVSAADMSVTGTATMTYTGGDEKATLGNGWVMGDSVSFSATGEVTDNMTATYSVELDGTTGVDDYSLSMDFGDAGVLRFDGHGGSSFLSANDDVMPTASEEPWDVITGGDTGVINGHAANNAFKYTYAHDSGLNLTLTYINAADAENDVSYSDYGITYTGMPGLTIGYGQGDVEVTTGTQSDESTLFAKYAFEDNGIEIGIQKSEQDNQTGADVESTGIGISYTADEFALSYGSNVRETVGGNDQEAIAIGASYTVGSLGIAVSVHTIDNVNGTASDDREGYQMVLTFGF